MSTPQILVVDDEPEIAISLATYLSNKAGFHVQTANNGEEAMAILEKAPASGAGPIDLVVLDRRMPGLSGLEVLSWLREHPSLKYTRVVMLTGASASREKIKALSVGADDYITKPYYPQELLARVNTILRTQQLEKQLQRQSEQLAALNEVSSQTTSLEVNQILRAVARGVRKVVGAEAGAIFLQDQQQGTLQCRAVVGPLTTEAFGPIAAGEGLIGRVFREHGTLRSEDPPAESGFEPTLDLPQNLSLSSLLAAALIVRDRAVGVLWAANAPAGSFNDTDADLFTSLANVASRALENASLFQGVKARQQELQESHDRLQAVINGILHPIYTIDRKWRLVAVNSQQAASIDSLQQSSLRGRVCYEAFFDRSTPCEHCQVGHLLGDGESRQWSMRWLGEDHLPQEWDIYAYPLPGRQPDAPAAVVVWQDRTEERRLENSLMQAGKLAAIGQLAAGVAHEINNPLTAINANAQILKMFIPTDDDMYESVDLIARAGDRASNVVRGLLDFARQNQYSFESGDVNESILQALHLLTYQLKSANITVIHELDQALPEIQASWEHLKTVWLNLLINARDAVVKGNGLRQIEIISRPDAGNDGVQVIISDTGVGISPAEVTHIFEPFYTTKDPGQGTGLGLATSQRIVQQHGGTIEVAAEPEAGATFIVRLPQRSLPRP